MSPPPGSKGTVPPLPESVQRALKTRRGSERTVALGAAIAGVVAERTGDADLAKRAEAAERGEKRTVDFEFAVVERLFGRETEARCDSLASRPTGAGKRLFAGRHAGAGDDHAGPAAVAAALDELWAGLSPLDLLETLPRWRWALAWYYAGWSDERRVLMEGADELRLDATLDPIRAVICSTDNDGHLRERSVRFLGQCRTPYIPTVLIPRLNDWVPEVRVAARGAFRAQLVPGQAAAVLRCLPELRRLEGCGREDHRPFLAEVEAFLCAELTAEGVEVELSLAPARTRREIYSLRLKGASLGDARGNADTARAAEVFERAARDPDSGVRVWAARSFPRQLHGMAAEGMARRCLADRFYLVRRMALEFLVEAHATNLEELLLQRLFDPNPSVRWIAFFYLRERFGYRRAEVADIYRKAAVAGSPLLAAAVDGLGEAGGLEEDRARLLGFWDHPATRVKVAALHALARLGGGEFDDLLREAARSPVRKIARAGARLRVGRRRRH